MELKHPHQLSVGDLVLGRHHDEVLMVVRIRAVNNEFYLRLVTSGGDSNEYHYRYGELLPWVGSSLSSCCHACNVKKGDWLLVNQNEAERVIKSSRSEFRGQDLGLQEIFTESAEGRVHNHCVPVRSFAMVCSPLQSPFSNLIGVRDVKPGMNVGFFNYRSQVAFQGSVSSIDPCDDGRLCVIIGKAELYFRPNQYLFLEAEQPDQPKLRTEVKGHLSVEMILDA